ncbi:SIR2 family protein [Rubrobacter indicoceani]|uniref:SIR2 family protein n=1 Tax=Rubrobacter indicoceani TaxID=2051957 RepID=UPI0013C4BC62|nr:SIR2 family protein [Rubrobacter indicoceani]
MRVKPELSLAFAMHAGPGTYALLLGSGVSRAAGVPTGWEVTLDLVRKLAAAEGQDTDDPETWYRERFDQAPNYSEVVNALAPTRDERRALLQGYFEPNEHEREEGKKVPTDAHRAVARLCAEGHVRVILTTNFDRLLERALEAENVSPVVIDTPDAVEGAPPLQHSGCTVVKIHGDYLDTRIKNTPEELKEYDPRVNTLLERIFDEYGLVICGWSGTYDTALVDALKRVGSRRYMAYWVSRGEPSEGERSLTSFIRGTSIEAAGADEFFTDLLEKVEALDTFGGDDPLSAPVAVATAKRYLDDPTRDVRLRELVSSIGRETREKLFGESRFPMSWRPPATDRSAESAGFASEMKRRILSYERSCEAAVGLMAAGGYYAAERKIPAFRELLELSASPPRVDGSYLEMWGRLELYPAVLLLYAGGVPATATENWPFLRALLRDSESTDIYGPSPLILKVYPRAVSRQKEMVNAALHDDTRYYEPIAEWLYKTLREPLREYLALDFMYESAFHRFEVLLSLVHVDVEKDVHPDKPHRRDWAPLGRFAVVHKMGYGDPSAYSQMKAEYDEQGRNWAPIESGLLKQPVSTSGTTKSVDTVGHNFDVIDAMIGKMGYF